VVHDEEDVYRTHGYMGADEAEYDDGQYEVPTGNEAIELESEELDQEGQPGPPNVEETHGPQGSPTIAIHNAQDLEPNMDDYEADTAEEAEENVDDGNHPSSNKIQTEISMVEWIHSMGLEVGDTI